MKITRRTWNGAAIAATLAALCPTGRAQGGAYPSRPLRIIVPASPGGGMDLISRTISIRLSEQMGQPVVVDNRPGGNMVIGTQALASAPADGYTIMMASPGHAINPGLQASLPFDPVKDFAGISYVCYIPLVLVVNPKVPANSVAELVALAKSQPGKLSFGYGGTGAASHISGEMFKRNTGIDILGIPYKGNAPALNDLIAGQITMYFDIVTTSLPHIKAGKLKALALTGPNRSSLLPDVQTMEELGMKSFDVPAWYMFIAPAGTPQAVIATLNREISQAVKHPSVGARLSSQGVEWVAGSPAQADAFLKSEVDRWTSFVKQAGIKGG